MNLKFNEISKDTSSMNNMNQFEKQLKEDFSIFSYNRSL